MAVPFNREGDFAEEVPLFIDGKYQGRMGPRSVDILLEIRIWPEGNGYCFTTEFILLSGEKVSERDWDAKSLSPEKIAEIRMTRHSKIPCFSDEAMTWLKV